MRLRTFGGLWLDDHGVASDAGPRPRPLALLAILAVAGAKGTTRDRVLGVLWPETEEERARQSLSQAIYSLRRDLGLEVAQSTAGLRLDPQQITSDVGDFRAAVAAKRWSDAAPLYLGPFLDGFYLADAPEFERWAESERASLATEGIRALGMAAKASALEGHREEAAEYWSRLARLDPASPQFAASYMNALATLGDHAAALAHGRAHTELLRREFDAEPDHAVSELMTQLRDASVRLPRVPSAPGVPAAARESKPTVAAAPVELAPRAFPRRSRAAVFAALTLGMLGVGALGFRWWTVRRAAPPVLAVGRLRDLATADSAERGGLLSEMLATSLGRLTELQVIANSRMLELTPRDADTSRTALTDAARRAGATEIIEGELTTLPDSQLRLEIRRVDIARGLVRGGYRLSGNDRITLFDSVTALIAADFRVGAPAVSLAEVSTRSPIAYRFYEEGLRALYQFDAYAANRLFQSAVREDSSFAMATYYAWRTAKALGDSREGALALRAVSLAARASTRDRLLIMTHVGAERADMRAIAAAETLTTRYARDPEALVLAAAVTPDLARAVQLLNRSIALDSAAIRGSTALCRLCDALSALTSRYEWADSVDAVRRTLQRWHALRPQDATPWALESNWLIGFGRRSEADAAMRRHDALGGTRGNVHLANLVQSLRLDAFDDSNRACEEGLTTSDSTAVLQYRWFCAIGLRMQGRYREAIALVHDGRVPRSTVVRRGLPPERYQAAILDMETGRGREAADEFLAIHRPADIEDANAPDGFRARYATWLLTLSATAAVSGGDTARARRVVDSIENIGQRSLYARDPLLHHFVRGLLFARGHQQEAAVREFRAAIHSPTYGYTRINYELARSLLELKRPGEAVPLLQAALHGGLEGSGLYVTRTELHELLAQSFDANRQRDSAAAHYAVVARAWTAADPFLAPRRSAAQQWLSRLR